MDVRVCVCVCVCCAGSGPYDEPIIRPEKSYRVCCLFVGYVVEKPQQRGGLGPRWTAAPKKKKMLNTHELKYLYCAGNVEHRASINPPLFCRS